MKIEGFDGLYAITKRADAEGRKRLTGQEKIPQKLKPSQEARGSRHSN